MTGVEWSGVEVEWSRVQCSAVEWKSGMGCGMNRMMQNEWSGVEWSRVEWSGVEELSAVEWCVV